MNSRTENTPTHDEIEQYWNSYVPPQSNNYPENNYENVHLFNSAQNKSQNATVKGSGRLTQSTKYPADFQLAVYGSKAAIQVKPSVTKGGFFTVALESANAKNGATRVYDWAGKITIQLTRTELLDFAAVLLCHKPSCKYSAHGDKNNKGFELAFQPERKSFFMSLTAPGQKHSVEVPYIEGMQIGHLAISLYIDNYPGLTTDTVLAGLNRMSNLYNQTTK